jgi:uncharacterized protein DUF488
MPESQAMHPEPAVGVGSSVMVRTIGLGGRNVDAVVSTLREIAVKRVLDLRPRRPVDNGLPVGEVALILWAFGGGEYSHEPLLTPPPDLWQDFKQNSCGWTRFEKRFLGLLAARGVEEKFNRQFFSVPTILLGARGSPSRCHRRLVLEYLRSRGLPIDAIHL